LSFSDITDDSTHGEITPYGARMPGGGRTVSNGTWPVNAGSRGRIALKRRKTKGITQTRKAAKERGRVGAPIASLAPWRDAVRNLRYRGEEPHQIRNPQSASPFTRCQRARTACRSVRGPAPSAARTWDRRILPSRPARRPLASPRPVP